MIHVGLIVFAPLLCTHGAEQLKIVDPLTNPTDLQPELLDALEYLKEHPEEIKGPEEVVGWVLANVYIRWEDIPDPGAARSRQN
jgi:hypothetical protein